MSIGYTSSYTSPNGNLLLSLLVLPVTANHLAGYTHTSADVSELDIAVSTLVQVHEVHVDLAPGDFGIILCVEVAQRLLQLLQTLDPHLCRREGVHPGNDTYALLVVVGSQHYLLYFLRAVGCTFIYNLNGDVTRGVQTLYHLLRVTVNGNYCVASVQELCASYPPNFVVLKCFHYRIIVS